MQEIVLTPFVTDPLCKPLVNQPGFYAHDAAFWGGGWGAATGSLAPSLWLCRSQARTAINMFKTVSLMIQIHFWYVHVHV